LPHPLADLAVAERDEVGELVVERHVESHVSPFPASTRS
jgi:hypothetical protein